MQATREAIMNDQERPGTESTTTTPLWRALAAAGFALGTLGIVAGLGGMVWLHTSSVSHAAGGNDASAAAPTAATGENHPFLHAPASWPSVPRAEDVFANQPGAPVDDVPAPSF